MTGKADFTPEEWHLVLEGPPSAGLIVITAQRGGSFRESIARGRFLPSTEFAELARADAILICVPTPLTAHREPDLTYVENTARAIAKELRRGQLIVLESTTYPGTTRDVVAPLLEATGLGSGSDFFLGYSPEREDPGNPVFHMINTPKIVAGEGSEAARLGADHVVAGDVIDALPRAFTEGDVPNQ